MDEKTIIYLLVGLNLLLILWLAFLTWQFISQKRFFSRFTADVTKKDLKSLLENLAKSFKEVGLEINQLGDEVKIIKAESSYHFQKVGFLRYNPFSDTGGDQSFCLCLLDKLNNGIVITSLHSREQTRIYAKAVSHGKPSGYEFAKEEQEALNLAIKKRSAQKS